MAKKGRPRKPLPEGWKETVLSLMKEGASKVEVMAELDISNNVFYKYVKEDKDFDDTIKKGETLSQGWWEKQGRINLDSKSFNHVLWYMNMKNRFRESWNDRSELTITKADGVVFVE